LGDHPKALAGGAADDSDGFAGSGSNGPVFAVEVQRVIGVEVCAGTSNLAWLPFFHYVYAALKKHDRPEIPRKTIYRLSVYLRCLARLKENAIRTVSSEALATVAGVKSTQLRKDLTYFGQFGTRGLGYDVEQLAQMISDVLGTKSLQPVVLVGVGNLGLALLSYRGFEREGFEIVAAFDVEPRRKRDKEIKQPIYGMDKLREFAQTHRVKMAILTVPAEVAQEVTNTLVQCGIAGILNFASIVLHVPEEVMVNNVNLASELENLSYFIQE